MARPQRRPSHAPSLPVDPASLPSLPVAAVDQEARGVAHLDGKVVFIDGALPREQVRVRIYKRRPSYDQAEAQCIERAAAERVQPACPHFGVCGGCNMQHAHPAAQVAYKQRILEDNLLRIGRVRAGVLLPTIQGPDWGYRHRARLSVRLVQKKGGVLVGFHERNSSFVADMHSCRVLPARVSALLPALRSLVGGLSLADRLPQIEVAVGETAVVLVLRILQALSAEDHGLLESFARQQGVQIWTQTKGPDTVARLYPAEAAGLHYSLPEFGLTMPFAPTEFTQVNPAVNRVLVRRAMAMLQLQPGQRAADLFCGLGNFSLPMAVQGAEVVGIEGSAALVRRAAENAALHGLSARARFEVADLFQATPALFERLGALDAVLIDPPRDGAIEVVKALSGSLPPRLVYVSCNPATLARDAQVLVHQHGYTLQAAGIANMFPHTAHVESIALFTRPR